jgi:hypothetical protein
MTGQNSLIEHVVENRVCSAGVGDGWTPLEFYAFIVRTLGLPARFTFDGKTWVGEAPFTKPVPQSILDLLEAQGV